MKQTIGFLLMLVWMALFILGAAEPTGEYQVDTPKWVGWAYIIVLLGAPFIAINLLASDTDKK